MDSSQPYVKIFCDEVPVDVLGSGYAICFELVSITVPKTGAELDERSRRITQTIYFKVGMSELESKQALANFKRD